MCHVSAGHCCFKEANLPLTENKQNSGDSCIIPSFQTIWIRFSKREGAQPVWGEAQSSETKKSISCFVSYEKQILQGRLNVRCRAHSSVCHKLINAFRQTCFTYLVSSEVRAHSNIRIFWLLYGCGVKIILQASRNESAHSLDFKGRDEENVTSCTSYPLMLTDDWLGCRFVFNTDMIMERQQEDKWAYFQNCDTLPLKKNLMSTN